MELVHIVSQPTMLSDLKCCIWILNNQINQARSKKILFIIIYPHKIQLKIEYRFNQISLPIRGAYDGALVPLIYEYIASGHPAVMGTWWNE